MGAFSSRRASVARRGHSRVGSVRMGSWLLAVWMAAGAPAFAADSWIWLDSQGRKVYSDMPPPPSLATQRILQRPGIESTPASLPAATAPATEQTSAPAADASQNKQGERPLYQRNEDTLRENCRRARAALLTLNSGLRLQMLNDKGEQVDMDAATREREIRRTQQDERDNCVPERKNGKR